jgi:hypothetical protein
MTSLGIKHNNYLKLKNGDSLWMDAGGKESKSDSKGHAIFADPAYGVRAGILQLRSYFFKHNRRTIAEILARWAPATDSKITNATGMVLQSTHSTRNSSSAGGRATTPLRWATIAICESARGLTRWQSNYV